MKIKIADLNFTTKGNESVREGISVRKGDPPDQIIDDMSQTGIWNAVQDDPILLENRLSVSTRLIQNPRAFFEEPSKQILMPGTPLEHRWKFKSTAEKNFVIKMIDRYVQEIPGAKGIAGTVLGIADELFTNALFNAPFGDLDSTLDRTTLVVLDTEMSAEIIVGYTDDRLFLGCVDAFGSLNCDSLLNRIYNGFKSGISQSVNMETGGAGIGILRMVELSSDIYVIVEKSKKTLVGCSFNLNRSPRKIRQAPKNFHFQSYQTIEFQSGKIRIEQRGPRATLRMFDEIPNDFPMAEIDLMGVEEISFDLKFMKEIQSRSFRIFLEIAKNISSLKKIYFEYVPYNGLLGLNDLVKHSEIPAEIRSTSLPFHCSTCEVATNLRFVRCEETFLDSHHPVCPKCGKNLVADVKI